MNTSQTLLKGIIKENPVLVLLLGTCPTLAVTGDVKSAVGMAAAVPGAAEAVRRVCRPCRYHRRVKPGHMVRKMERYAIDGVFGKFLVKMCCMACVTHVIML